MKKRYQYYGNGGELKWTEWFEWDSQYKPKYQLGKKLLNEYIQS